MKQLTLQPGADDLKHTWYINSGNKHIQSLLDRLLTVEERRGEGDHAAIASRLFYYVRDSIRYDIEISPRGKVIWYRYSMPFFRASTVARREQGFCISKAVLLTALLRASGIPARIRFAHIRNNMAGPGVSRFFVGNLFRCHGYVKLHNGRKWVSVNPAFDKKLCEKNGYPMNDFDGTGDALSPAADERGNAFIDYVEDKGEYQDVPYWRIIFHWTRHYNVKFFRKVR